MALIMVMLVVCTLMVIAALFSRSVTAEYSSAANYRRAAQAEAFCLAGLHRAQAELMYDVWGVNEDRPFESARYNPEPSAPPHDNLQALGAGAGSDLDRAAYFECSSGELRPVVRQSGFWNGEAWVVWAGEAFPEAFPEAEDWEVDRNVWNMDPRQIPASERTGGAQRYLSYGQGTVEVCRGSKVVRGTGTAFDASWPAGTDISINGVRCDIRVVKGPEELTLWNPWTAPSGSGLGWGVGGIGSACGSADGSLPGGPAHVRGFVRAGRGHAANPRWINPEHFVSRSPAHGPSFRLFGGADLNGDGRVDAVDRALRNWALWKLRCDAFLPEAMDNNDAFEAQMHANDRLRGSPTRFAPSGRDIGYEFISPLIVGDSFYQIFRSDPIHTMHPGISGEDPGGGSLDARSDLTGFRYPYDLTHTGRCPGVLPADDPAGGLVNINQVNNNHGSELWLDTPQAGGGPGAAGRRHIMDAKWIYCYDPRDAGRRPGRYAVTVMPDCSLWNAAALQGGTPDPYSGLASSSRLPRTERAAVGAGGAFIAALRRGFDAASGEPAAAELLAAVDTGAGGREALCCYAPIRPAPLPINWSAAPECTPPGPAPSYWCPDGAPDASQGAAPARADRTRAPEIWGAQGGGAWDAETGLRSAVFSYLVWLGPYSSRAEFATHLRKAGICLPLPGSIRPSGGDAASRACMETDINATEDAGREVARSARLIAATTTVHGYFYSLDRFWDRSLLVIDWGSGPDGADSDRRFGTAQCSPGRPVDCATAGTFAGQRTRQALLRELNALECFGGYRTRDGKFRLLDYLFREDDAPGDYLRFLENAEEASCNPLSYSVGPVYGGRGPVQERASRREKFMATAASRLASAQRPDGQTAACANGHLLHNPRLSVFHRPAWSGGAMTMARRSSARDECHDEMAAGCPVCGGRLFLANIYELSINEIGAFRGRFRSAERPARMASDVRGDDRGGASRPMRHFVEVLLSGRYREGGASNALVRFDMLQPDPAGGAWLCTTPAVLADPVSGRPYFTSHLEFEQRWRRSCNPGSPDYAEGLDPEPVFRGLPNKPGEGAPFSSYLNLHLLVYDDLDNGGRWHDVTWGVDHPMLGLNHGTGRPDWYPGDPQLYDRLVWLDDTDPDPTRWSAAPLRCDEYYAMPDPDPAHRQADARAAVSIYRKVPVRWHGGDRRDAWELHYRVASSGANAPLGPPGSGLPAETGWLRGLGFSDTMRLNNRRAFFAHHDCLYAGDDAWLATPPKAPSPAGFASSTNTEWPAFQFRDPGQYGVISFDAKFDGSRVAMVYCQASKDIPEYGGAQRIVGYVELSDSAGRALRIGDTCRPAVGGAEARDASGRPSVHSWQARNPRDTRGNADGYMCWDLLPMTLNGEVTPANDPVGESAGYDPWWLAAYTPDCNWWCAGDDGFSSRAAPQSLPAGYRDLGDRMTCRNRNSNMWNRDIPVKRSAFDGTSETSANSREAVHEALIRSMHDHCNASAGSRRSYRDKSNAMSTPTGIGRQASAEEFRGAELTSRAGAQFRIAADFRGHACVWREGSGSVDPRQRWSGYSWNSWYKLFDVTDLCQAMLWEGNPEEGGAASEIADLVDSNQDGRLDETSGLSMPYCWSRANRAEEVPAVSGSFPGELRLVNKLNLNELWFPPALGSAGWSQSYVPIGRKPLKGYHSPSGFCVRQPVYSGADAPYDLHSSDPGYNLRITPWDLDADASMESGTVNANGAYYGRLEALHCGSSPVYTIFVTGHALDERGEPLAEMRLRATVERTWDGRCNILEFNWLQADGDVLGE
ncbi:MAG TPA: hypothetical protein PK280_06965 [Planctomycetota bacterium]|nr:hypothetical protein [Planctomycetota bacterium]